MADSWDPWNLKWSDDIIDITKDVLKSSVMIHHIKHLSLCQRPRTGSSTCWCMVPLEVDFSPARHVKPLNFWWARMYVWFNQTRTIVLRSGPRIPSGKVGKFSRREWDWEFGTGIVYDFHEETCFKTMIYYKMIKIRLVKNFVKIRESCSWMGLAFLNFVNGNGNGAEIHSRSEL